MISLPNSGMPQHDNTNTQIMKTALYSGTPEARWGVGSGVFRSCAALATVFSAFLLLLPFTLASAFTFDESNYEIVGGYDFTLTSNQITDSSTPITGSHQVDVRLISTGEIDEIILRGDTDITINAGDATTTLFAAYDFTANGSVLIVDIQARDDQFGTASLEFTVNTGTGTVGSALIDTRLQGDENMAFGFRYAEDPMGGLLDFSPSTGGVTITEDRMTGLIWSENFGWIDLQPVGGGLTVTVVTESRAEIDGYAWNDNVGWLYFGKIDDEGGVYIDGDGYVHGTAWSESFGYFTFGDYMEMNPYQQVDNIQTSLTRKTYSWAKTEWQFTDNNTPTIDLVSPADTATTVDRTPTFTFHIEEEDGEDVGYLVTVEREISADVWAVYQSYELPSDSLILPNGVGENHTHDFGVEFPPGSYRWRMRAFDEFFAWSDYTSYWEFNVDNVAPQTGLRWPAHCDGADLGYGGVPCGIDHLSNRRPTFRFTIEEADADNIQYVVQISQQSDFSTILPQSSALSPYAMARGAGVEYTYTPSFNLPSGDLYWRVVATDIHGSGETVIPYNHFEIYNQLPVISNVYIQDNNNNVIPDSSATYDTAPTAVWTGNDLDTGATGILTAHIDVYDTGDNLLESIEVDHRPGQYQRGLSILSPGDYYVEVWLCDEDTACTAKTTINFAVENRDKFGNVGTVVIASMRNTANEGRMIGTDVDSENNKYAWNATNGWIDMNPVGGGVIVENSRVIGYAWNDILGWIRMNCIAPTADTGIIASGGGQIADECGTNDYGVSNAVDAGGDFSSLTGKAFVEATGDYIYFDEQTYLDDSGDTSDATTQQIDVDISCDNTEVADADDGHVTLGHFLGNAWSPAMGWIAFGRQDLIDAGMAAADAAENFPITEWSCSGDQDPDLIVENQYVVFDARDEDYRYAIAQRSNSPFSEDIVCDDNSGVNGTEIIVEKMNPDGTLDYALSDLSGDFSIGCENPDGDDDGKLWLTIHDGPSHQATRTPGIYRIRGTVADEQDYSVDFPVDTGSPHLFSNEYVFQVVSAEPDLTHADTILTAGSSNPLVADGEDQMAISISLYDRFDNPVGKEYIYQDPTETPANILKTVELRSVFWDNVQLDQVNSSSAIRQAVDFSIPKQDIGAPPFDTGNPAVQYFDADVESGDTMLVNIGSYAPTNTDNDLKLSRIETVVRQIYDTSNRRLDVGQTDGYPNQVKKTNVNIDVDFTPIITAKVPDFAAFGLVDSEEDVQQITLTNNSDTVHVTDYDWLAILKTTIDGGLNGGTYYGDLKLYSTSDTSQPPFVSTKEHYLEVSASGSTALFNPGKSSQFNKLIKAELDDGYNNFLIPGNPLVIFMKQLSQVIAGSSYTFHMTGTPRRNLSYLNVDEYPTLVQAITIGFDTNNDSQADKFSKFALESPTSPNPLTFLVMSIAGAVHGEAYNETIIVGKDAGTQEFSMVGDVYGRPEIRRIMYENYASITGNKSPSNADIELPGNGYGIVNFDDWTDFTTTYSDTSDSNSTWLQDGQVRWVERPESVTHMSVNIGDIDDSFNKKTFTIPSPPAGEEGPITLLVRGGNVYIRDNIIVESGRSLGIIVLRSGQQAGLGTEGNVFIDPSVTRIEAAIYADGSIMSALDVGGVDGAVEEAEIFDGFSTNVDALSNQLLLKGSFVSQNIAGTSGDAEIPSKDVWLPAECSPFTDCFGNNSKIRKSAKRYDYSFMRRYRLISDLNDADLDGIEDSIDCERSLIPGQELFDPATDGSSFCNEIPGSNPAEYYNPLCQDPNGILLPVSLRPDSCTPQVTTRAAMNNGLCALGTPWCTDPDNTYTATCGTNTDVDQCASDGGDLINKKIGASVIIEYDPRVKNLTPVGMDLPAIVDFTRN